MVKRLAASVAGLSVVLLIVSPALAVNGGRPVSTPMTGAEEAPGPGDSNAFGQADFRLNQGQSRVCFELSWTDIDGTVVAAHIHLAPPGEPGAIVVPLFEGTFSGTDSASGCVENVDRDLIKDIRQDPSAYYVNVHSSPNFLAGAIRGQLEK